MRLVVYPLGQAEQDRDPVARIRSACPQVCADCDSEIDRHNLHLALHTSGSTIKAPCPRVPSSEASRSGTTRR